MTLSANVKLFICPIMYFHRIYAEIICFCLFLLSELEVEAVWALDKKF